jgi:hypothetical protein
MNLAALVLTVVFVADDPALPALSLEVVEQAGARTMVAAIVPPSTPPEGLERKDAVGRAVLPAGASPIGPKGTSIVPAVDGVIVTIEDAGTWAAAFSPPPPPPTSTTAKAVKPTKPTKPPPSTHPWPPPSLPVAGPRALRLFLPAVVDGVPMSASLHAPGGVAVPGLAVAFTRLVDSDGVVVTRAEGEGVTGVEVAAPRQASSGPVTPCTIEPTPIQLREVSGAGGPALCIGALEIRSFGGVRHGDQPAKDRPSRGVVLRRVAPPGPGATPAGRDGAPPKPPPSRY